MRKKSRPWKILKITVGSLLGFAALLFIVLIIHIAVMVKGQPPIVNATVQMARADFEEPIDSMTAIKIQNKVKTMTGIKSTYFNPKTNILIYTFDNRQNNAQNIYDHAIKNSEFKSKRYLVSAQDLKYGCPVMNSNTFYGKLTQWVSKIVN